MNAGEGDDIAPSHPPLISYQLEVPYSRPPITAWYSTGNQLTAVIHSLPDEAVTGPACYFRLL
jgi:hypothetical protein